MSHCTAFATKARACGAGRGGRVEAPAEPVSHPGLNARPPGTRGLCLCVAGQARAVCEGLGAHHCRSET